MEELFGIQNSAAFYWVLAGIVLVLIEVSVVPGIGFLFAGLGAITLGALLIFGFFEIHGWFEHIAYFFFFTTIWAVVLWAPLKRAVRNSKGEGYSNIIGDSAVTLEDLEEGKMGRIKWSGTTMRARIALDSTSKKIAKGETVWIHENKGGLLHVDTKEVN